MKKLIAGLVCSVAGMLTAQDMSAGATAVEQAVAAELSDADIARIKAKLAERPLLSNEIGAYWQGNIYPYEDLNGVVRLGRTPVRHSRDVKKSGLGIGYETLDRYAFDPGWTFKPIGETGVKWARCQTGWVRCEKEKGVYDFAWLDEVVDGLAAEGVETWFSVSYGNHLYTQCGKFERELAEAKATGGVAPGWARGCVGEGPVYYGEEAVEGWKRYVRAMARHFKGRVRVWEIWNEPEGFWRDQFEIAGRKYGVAKAAQDFAGFMRLTAAVIREEIPTARVSFNLAALSSGWVPVLAKAGIGEFIDIFNYHGYEPYPEAALDAMYAQVRALFRRPDGTPLEIWQGESGRSAGKSPDGICLPTQYSQARFIPRRVVSDLFHGAKVSSIYTVTDHPNTQPTRTASMYGVLNLDTRKPRHAWYTLQCLGWLCDGLEPAPENFVYFATRTNKEFTDHLPYAAVKTASFRRNGVPVLAVWQPQHVELNTRPLCGCIRFVIGDSIGKIRHPVMIDPVRCEVWDIASLFADRPADVRLTRLGIDTVNPFYALDYPLFITDISIFDK